MSDNNTIWIFGDSFSTDLMHKSVIGWTIPYIKWKGYAPQTFPRILSKELNLPVKNFAEGGIGNDTIFETIYNNSHNIKENDVIIIGWTTIERFRHSMIDSNKWYHVVPNSHMLTKKESEYISENTIHEILINRSHPIYKNELADKVNFINWLHRNAKIIHWSSVHTIETIEYFDDIERITTETNKDVDDLHFSENGNIKLANIFLKKLQKYNEK